MKAQVLVDERIKQGDNAFAELRVVRVPESVRGSAHIFKYSLSLVVEGECVLRYDNEAGKGDHKHYGLVETQYKFESPEQLLADFWLDVAQWRDENE